ncbi:MAG: hypothetical protein HOE61_08240 [Candidatus Marinimicrobia bacterium]|jgi:TPR repeat protein|nr:hypothetical protein [Candidatus Neomarinimicrobiota bacterium]
MFDLVKKLNLSAVRNIITAFIFTFIVMGFFVEESLAVGKPREEVSETSPPAAALAWLKRLKKAVDQGISDAQFDYGELHRLGKYVPKDLDEAARLYLLAAEQGHAKAQRNIALMYRNGTGVSKDYAKSILWFRKSADQNYAKAQFGLARMYAVGFGVDQNIDLAENWYLKAAEQGHVMAMNNLAFMWAENNKNLEEAERFSRAAFKKGPEDSAVVDTLGWVLFRKGEYKESVKFLKRAAEISPSIGEIWGHLGIALVSTGNTNDAASAIEKSSSLGSPQSIHKLLRSYRVQGRIDKAVSEPNGAGSACISFHPPLDSVDQVTYSDYVSVTPQSPDARTTYRDGKLCIDGLSILKEYAISIRPDLPTDDDLTLVVNDDISVIIEDQSGNFVRRLRASAQDGDQESQKTLGGILQTLGKYEEASKWLSPIAVNGDAIAQYVLGSNYHFGKGVPQDYKIAADYFRKAAEQGLDSAQFSLAMMYDNGFGVSKNLKQAHQWLLKAAKQGHAKSQSNLGLMYKDGRGIPQDYAAALKWLTKSAEQGTTWASHHLGQMHLNGLGVPANNPEALKWHIKAAEGGLVDSQFTVGKLYGGVSNWTDIPKDHFEAAYWYKKGAKQGHLESQMILGRRYYLGEGVRRSIRESKKWYLEAAKKNDAAAYYTLGIFALEGIGERKDLERAFAWFGLASMSKTDSVIPDDWKQKAEEEMKELKQKLTPSQKEEAMNLVLRWMAKHNLQ